MFGRGDEAAFDGVVVQIVEFLEHYRIGADGFGVRAFLPDLVFVSLVRGAVVTELVEEPVASFFLGLGDELFGGEAFQVAEGGGEIGRGENGVEVGVEDDVGVDF